jgi:uncharacterized protein (TIGR02246 family)
MRSRTLLAAAVGVLLVTGCYPAAGPLSDEDVAAIAALGQQYVEASLAGDAAGIAAVYAEDATEMPPGMVATEGRAAIEARYAEGDEPSPTTFTITSTEIVGFGDLAYDVGTWAAAGEVEGMDPIEVSGKYVCILERQADGSWLWKEVIWNYDMPMPTYE